MIQLTLTNTKPEIVTIVSNSVTVFVVETEWTNAVEISTPSQNLTLALTPLLRKI